VRGAVGDEHDAVRDDEHAVAQPVEGGGREGGRVDRRDRSDGRNADDRQGGTDGRRVGSRRGTDDRHVDPRGGSDGRYVDAGGERHRRQALTR
jgi:hypothetical protein